MFQWLRLQAPNELPGAQVWSLVRGPDSTGCNYKILHVATKTQLSQINLSVKKKKNTTQWEKKKQSYFFKNREKYSLHKACKIVSKISANWIQNLVEE